MGVRLYYFRSAIPYNVERMTRIKHLGERLRELREEAKLSQAKLADLVGVSRNAVSQWESGETQPSSRRLASIAKALKVPVDSFLGPVPALRERILAATVRTVDRVGILNLSVDVICAAADVSRAQFESVFGSQDQVLNELVNEFIKKAFADARRSPPKYGSLLARIKYLLRTFYVNDLADIQMTAALHAYSWQWSAEQERENNVQLFEYHQMMLSLFDESAARGQIEQGNFSAASQLIFAAYTQSLRKALFEGYDADRLVAYIEPQIAIILSGFAFENIPGFSDV